MIHKTLQGNYIDLSKIVWIGRLEVQSSPFGTCQNPYEAYFYISFQLMKEPICYSIDLFNKFTEGTLEERFEKARAFAEIDYNGIVNAWKNMGKVVVSKLFRKGMKASELRIKNLINHEGDVLEVIEIKMVSIDGNPKINGWDEEEIEPIPLKQQWLLKFGFERFPMSAPALAEWDEYVKDGFEVFNYGTSLQEYYFKAWDGKIIKLEYVHQLQNLYFSLTGKEL